jgi:protein PhnA
MSTDTELRARSENACEMCASPQGLNIYEVPPESYGSADKSVLICETCRVQIDNPDKMDTSHWRCLNDSMWSQVPAVQVVAWRMLKRFSTETWAADLLDMLFLDDDVADWARQEETQDNGEVPLRHLDSNGSLLAAGDTVTLIKDLNVKGAGFTAKRGTAVRNISLVPDNALHIEGRVNGQQIVILTEFVKK